MRIFRSTVIDAPVDKIWAILRQFDGVEKWNPGVSKACIENDRSNTDVGCIRHLTLPDGAVIRETLLELSDTQRFFTYDIIESPLPVRNYVATQRFFPITEGNRTYASWEVTFETEPGLEREMEETVGVGIFEGGFAGMKSYFEISQT